MRIRTLLLLTIAAAAPLALHASPTPRAESAPRAAAADTVPGMAERWRSPFAVESSGELAPREPRPPVVRLARDTTRTVAARPAATTAPDTVAADSVRTDTTAAAAARRAAAKVAARPRPAARDSASARQPEKKETRPAQAAKTGPRTHVVGRGDTLLGIARKYGVSTERIRSANRLKSDQVNLGQKLVIPAPE